MTQQSADRLNIYAQFQQTYGKAVTKCVKMNVDKSQCPH